MKHRCRWLHFQEQNALQAMPGRKARKAEKAKAAYCWQRGKTLRISECQNCLLARLVTVASSVFNALDHKQAMTEGEWKERHGTG